MAAVDHPIESYAMMLVAIPGAYGPSIRHRLDEGLLGKGVDLP